MDGRDVVNTVEPSNKGQIEIRAGVLYFIGCLLL